MTIHRMFNSKMAVSSWKFRLLFAFVLITILTFLFQASVLDRGEVANSVMTVSWRTEAGRWMAGLKSNGLSRCGNQSKLVTFLAEWALCALFGKVRENQIMKCWQEAWLFSDDLANSLNKTYFSIFSHSPHKRGTINFYSKFAKCEHLLSVSDSGRFGNQVSQYATLYIHARRLEVVNSVFYSSLLPIIAFQT